MEIRKCTYLVRNCFSRKEERKGGRGAWMWVSFSPTKQYGKAKGVKEMYGNYRV